jgi:transposase InsO family protein
MDFVADQLADGRKIRTLTIIDLYTWECLAIEVGFSLRAEHVVAAVNQLEHSRGLPERISCDNGSEFSGGQIVSGGQKPRNSGGEGAGFLRQKGDRGQYRHPDR